MLCGGVEKMKLKSLILKNFRSYKEIITVNFDDLTALIGKNDIGKSTILEALEIFFNNNQIKIESQDPCVYSDSKDVTIGCVFSDFPEEIVIDSTVNTSLKDEYLLNENGFLEIHKVFDCSGKNPKEIVYAIANHPTNEGYNDLLTLKNSELKKRFKDLGFEDTHVDLRSNVSIRKALWHTCSELSLACSTIPLNKEDAKAIWENISKQLPTFALFRADRPSTDEDAEVQDPMKLAVIEAIRSVEDEIAAIKEKVKNNVIDVAGRTLEKIREMDAELASELLPNFKSEQNWAGLFKLTLAGDDHIPINKRGSGVRRLILLNFFRAEAERKQRDNNAPGIIYAVEEPETSQHPSNQKMIVEALQNLSHQDNCQVILTTHVPGLVGLLPLETLRFIEKDENGDKVIRSGDEETYKKIAQTLGIMPDNRVKIFVCVEGTNDVNFLKNISAILHQHIPGIPDLNNEDRIAFILLGGSTLKDWVYSHYLRNLHRPEVHIYDRDTETPPKYQGACDEVNRRGDNSFALLTSKREMENYIHPDAIQEALGVNVTFGDTDNVPVIVAQAVHQDEPSSKPWVEVTDEKRKEKERKAKRRLNNEAVKMMTVERLNQIDPNGEVIRWLTEIADRIK